MLLVDLKIACGGCGIYFPKVPKSDVTISKS
jgi:hypothetical protein